MNIENLIKELHFKAIRSSGAGGQHVNKVSSKIELTFNLTDSKVFSIEEKERLQLKLSNKINKEGNMVLFCDESRSQHKNKTIVIQRFIKLIEEALKQQKKRVATKTPKSPLRVAQI